MQKNKVALLNRLQREKEDIEKNYSDLVPPAVAVWLKRMNAKSRLENLNALESQE